MLLASCVPSSKPVPSTLSTPASDGSTHFLDLPAFDAKKDQTMADSVSWWNDVLRDQGLEMEVGVMGTKEIRMGSSHKGWLL